MTCRIAHPDFPDYTVSDTGEVFSTRTSRILKTYGAGPYKYQAVTLCNKGRMRKFYVAHLVAWAFLDPTANFGKIKGSLQVNHIDGCNKNNAASNLEVVTVAQNRAHATTLPSAPKGHRNPQAKLTEAQVLEIRSLRGVEPYKSIAKRFGIHPMNVYMIWARKTWRHV